MVTRLPISALFFLSLSFSFLSSTTYAVTSHEVETLTQQVHDLHGQYRNASPGKEPQILAELGRVVAARKDLLVELIQQDPKEALRIAMPAHVRAGLPAAVSSDLEQDVTTDGTLEILHEDRDVGSRYLHFLWTAQDSRYSLHFADSPATLKTGDRVRVTGLRVQRVIALTSGSTNVTTLATALPNTLGSQTTLMILVNFQDTPTQPYSVSTATSVLNSTSTFDMENSYQQTWLTPTVTGWYTIPMLSTVCDYSTLATYARSAASSAGINLSAYRRIVYAFPQNRCGWWGLGSVGGNPSQAWINGSLQLRVLGHEMGHNLGLWHSHAQECGSVTIGTSCTSIEYGDTYDIMGASSGHFNAFQKQRLGWLNAGSSPPITTVQAGGSFVLDLYETTGTNSKALKILKDATSNTWYYVEFRRNVNGVVIHTGSDSNGNSSYLLDMTPATSSWSDAALGVGLTFYDPAAGVRISTQSVSSSNAVVNVSVGSVGGTSCVAAAPTVSLSPSQSQAVPAGTSVNYTVSIRNNDTGTCSTSSYSVQMIEPSGWSGSLGSSSVSITPGASVSTIMTVASGLKAPNGSYPMGATAAKTANTSLANTGSATYNIGTVPPPPCPTTAKTGTCPPPGSKTSGSTGSTGSKM